MIRISGKIDFTGVLQGCCATATASATTRDRDYLLSEELENRRRTKLRARLQCGRWKIGLIWRIRKMLCLQAKSLVFLIRRAALSPNAAVKKIAAV